MPIQDYKCAECGKRFEHISIRSDDLPQACPECGSEFFSIQVSAHGGYSMDSGPSSVRPKAAGSFKRGK